MFGCLLLYPAKDENNLFFIQSAGGQFTNGNPDHFGSGLSIENNGKFKEELLLDENQFDYVREVAWTTFGGVYIRRSVFDKIGNFSAGYEWTYNRDVDYCLRAREAGFKIYQVPVRLMHYESKDNKHIKAHDANKVKAEMRNLETLKNKWENSELYKTLDERVDG
jgi:GT2 family glycosyltransferase